MSGGRLDGKVALVTGGGSGIGEACARTFAREGATVVVVDRDAAAGERVVAALGQDGATASFAAADLVDPDAAPRIVRHAVETHGGLHVALNCAGISGPLVSTEEFPIEDWRSVIAGNLDSVFYCLRAELQHMLAHGGGAIVNMGSMFSVVGRDSYPAYVASKHGVLGLTRAAAIDVVQRGVRINCVGPAVIDTELLRKTLSPEDSQALADLNPTLRHGQPQEVANLVTWLCSDEASFVNGAFYAVDGAFTAR
jgi:NAD(P)-dependent dehydrogenase (short-subunit alcohol dehydrogenase family)